MVVCLHYVEIQTVKVKEPKKKVLECELELSVPVFPTDGSIRYTVLTSVLGGASGIVGMRTYRIH